MKHLYEAKRLNNNNNKTSLFIMRRWINSLKKKFIQIWTQPTNKSKFIANKMWNTHTETLNCGCCFESNKYLWYSRKQNEKKKKKIRRREPRFPIWMIIYLVVRLFSLSLVCRWFERNGKHKITYKLWLLVKSSELINRDTQSVIKYPQCSETLNELNVL